MKNLSWKWVEKLETRQLILKFNINFWWINSTFKVTFKNLNNGFDDMFAYFFHPIVCIEELFLWTWSRSNLILLGIVNFLNYIQLLHRKLQQYCLKLFFNLTCNVLISLNIVAKTRPLLTLYITVFTSEKLYTYQKFLHVYKYSERAKCSAF